MLSVSASKWGRFIRDSQVFALLLDRPDGVGEVYLPKQRTKD
jgi:hypothetical protein